jgi:voltage-gated potassium channel
MGLVLYFASTLTALLVDGNLRAVYRLKKMLKRLGSMREHTAVCGLSKTGSHVVEELVLTGHPCAVLDQDPDRVNRILEHYDGRVPALVGDATRDEDLLKLGVDRAKALVISLGEDVDNLYCTLSARQLNPKLCIIVTSDDHRLEQKYHHGGADSVVYPNLIGGQRIASQLVRPEVVTFLDLMLRDQKNILRIEQIRLPDSGHVVGRSLASSGIRRIGEVLVVAILRGVDGEFAFNPGPETTLQPNDTLIVLGEVGQIRAVREYVSGQKPSPKTSPLRSDPGRP